MRLCSISLRSMGLRARRMRPPVGYVRDGRQVPRVRGAVSVDGMPVVRESVSASRVVSIGAAIASLGVSLLAAAGFAQQPRPLMPIDFQRSAEFRQLAKPVQASRMLDDMTQASTWRM